MLEASALINTISPNASGQRKSNPITVSVLKTKKKHESRDTFRARSVSLERVEKKLASDGFFDGFQLSSKKRISSPIDGFSDGIDDGFFCLIILTDKRGIRLSAFLRIQLHPFKKK
jgi:hypothetical protein